jgi:hypothetical protein
VIRTVTYIEGETYLILLTVDIIGDRTKKGARPKKRGSRGAARILIALPITNMVRSRLLALILNPATIVKRLVLEQ